MHSRRSYNSFLFVTTLGVYLGLVLVGGTAPYVYAHAATARSFDISEEIEQNDDLDKKPDEQAGTDADVLGGEAFVSERSFRRFDRAAGSSAIASSLEWNSDECRLASTAGIICLDLSAAGAPWPSAADTVYQAFRSAGPVSHTSKGAPQIAARQVFIVSRFPRASIEPDTFAAAI